ncbi:nicotinate-nucleotide adenylyltransferase [Rhodobacter ferrooxidans]|uniref:Probable nicotinate-nucleotide adenylyltransferase n=1 Tax=Rhodobacter ferrooxidans TaxID=371731 RepID=C8S2V9_9RHOB|nr:nicotinate-nucleotide adenylyltransferase [Rhodobacter sp. SW2]EEW24599.1 nicotinate (nicotinamide) nucleotide adenylyltransferase [Rhodobacter sp. SW2]
MRQGFPIATPGMTIGLLGGSFDPAHEGHAHISREALKRFGLDRVWWLVSPGNPLKAKGPAPMAQRLARARAVMQHPRVVVTDLEARLGTRYTAATLAKLQAIYPGVRFVWLMGADNLAQFHRWERWEWIMAHVPVGVLARPGAGLAARASRAARIYRGERVQGAAAGRLGDLAPPAWCLANVPLVDLSSSAIRARGEWKVGGALPTQPGHGPGVLRGKPPLEVF